MRLSDYLREDLILHGLEASDARSALEAFGALFEEKGYVSSGQVPFQALMEREESHTTCLGHGIAVPHASLESLDSALLLVATGAAPIPFGPPDAEPVDLFFVLLSPPGRQGEHIKLLARICRLAQHPENLEEIRNATGKESMLDAVYRLDSRHV
jgi:mannitol/fructose-specific phosphotransferase system IIA component (Ntr-type)